MDFVALHLLEGARVTPTIDLSKRPNLGLSDQRDRDGKAEDQQAEIDKAKRRC